MDNGGAKTGFSIAGGISSDNGWASMSFEYLKQENVSAVGLPLIESALAPDGTSNTSPIGGGDISRMTFYDFGASTDINGDGIGDGIAYPGPGCPEEFLIPVNFGAQGQDCSYDFAPLYEAVPLVERMNFLVNTEYRLDDRVTGYGEFRMSRVFSEPRNGASPAFFDVTGFADLAEIDAQLGTDLANSSSVYLARRAVDAGPRAQDVTNTAFSVVLGGRVELGDGHELDMSITNIESEMNFVGVGGNLSRSRVSAAVANGTFNPFLQYDPQFFINEGIAVATQRQGTGTDRRFDLQVTGEIGDSGVGYAVGGQYREDDFVDTSDAMQIDRDVAGGAGSAGEGERESFGVFTEFAYSPIDSVELSAAARFDDYEWTGRDSATGEIAGNSADATTYMVGASWRPVENLMLRASYGTGFKAPTLGELYLGGSFGVTRAVDTRLCDAAQADPNLTPEEVAIECRVREIRSVSGGNVNLDTEESTNYSAGLVWEPTDNWSIAIDYYNIEVEGKIGSLTVQEILNNEDQYPELVNRIGGTLGNPDAFVSSNNQNLNQENGEGIDLSTKYDWDFDSGSFVTDLRIAYLLSHERQSSAVQPLCEDKGTTSEPEWRVNGQFGWQSNSDWSAVLTMRYLGETDDLIGGRVSGECGARTRIRPVDSYLEFGLRGTYNITEKANIAAGIINLTDEEPPFSEVASGGWPWFDQSLYDPRGTRYYVNFNYDFF